ncbi:MAG: biotin--[acetyl-CoA-carboxylase] ligase [Caulobacteraceae bacterium]|nr:biotin--[acetyl-CoA-carboxylase] ligase [Caulobacteraceae bacterium]
MASQSQTQVIATTTIPIVTFDEIDSTNAEARRRAEAGEAGPLWITALRQNAGRGRRGRSWDTGQGNLAATLLTTTDLPPAEAAQISFVAALAVADLARSYVPADIVGLKWPNDLLVAGRKASGILVESGRRPDGRLWLATGIGVNLAHAPEGTERPATSLALNGASPPPTPRQALERLSEAFAGWIGAWEARGFSAIAEAWTVRALGLGGPCVARLGAETVEGVAEGLDVDGALRLRLADGAIRRITAGDVFFEGA